MYPKIDLHTHLDGALKVSTMKELFEKKTSYPLSTDAKIQIQDGQPSLTEYLKYFQIPIFLLKDDLEVIERVAFEMVEQLFFNSVKYAEIRYAPQLLVSKITVDNCKSVINAVNKGFERGMATYKGIIVKSIICLMRGLSLKDNTTTYETVCIFKDDPNVVAIDLAGDEYNFSGEELKDLFIDAKKHGFHITMHAGENCSPESIKMAIDFGAERIGHGLSLWQDKELMSQIRDRQICIESCPISNFQTGAILRYDYKIKSFLDFGIHVCVNTDNLTVSNTNLDKEYKYLKQHYLFSKEDLEKMKGYAFKHLFKKTVN